MYSQTMLTEKVPIRSIAKALMVIEYLASCQTEVPLSNISSKLKMSKSTVHGILSTLKQYGYIEQSSFTGNYKLGIRFFELGRIVASTWDVRAVSGPYIQKLLERTGETVHLVVLDKGEVLYIDKRESNQSLRIVSEIGSRLPAHCTGVGKVLLAYLPKLEMQRIITTKGLPQYTKNTITDPLKLEEELKAIRERGYAYDIEEIMENLSCIAAPIFDYSGKAIAAISISGPSTRFTAVRLEEIKPILIETAAEISTSLGYRR
ncbi:transcriptional regulator, IclR family [Desulforamulus putei DSM 12395]|uniref:Glycerol operon regulatory protein n=1 Tax=Desulforamulus putei DSM 12395 TaxID=1121429 RepID=A0A1M5CJU0_9FIRM|nr:IclR family transcriptional regulator [Desulforamulus putei]SHF54867.1 transcriptional regulator, IclR family [Desulforamulus putei DSM 12395]